MGTKTTERWLPVVGYEDWYDVSNLGRVRRMAPARGTWVGRVLKGYHSSCTSGYVRVILCDDSDVKHLCTVHQLVMAAFIGPRQDEKQVNHKDGIKTNNHLYNLEYVTCSENHYHAYATGLKHKQRGEEHGGHKLTENDIHSMRKLFGEQSLESIAQQFRISGTHAARIRDRKMWGWLKDKSAVHDAQ